MRLSTFVDGTIRDILYALRGARRAPLVASTIVATVALGLGLVAVAFTVLNALLFRVDAASTGIGGTRILMPGDTADTTAPDTAALSRRPPCEKRGANWSTETSPPAWQ